MLEVKLSLKEGQVSPPWVQEMIDSGRVGKRMCPDIQGCLCHIQAWLTEPRWLNSLLRLLHYPRPARTSLYSRLPGRAAQVQQVHPRDRDALPRDGPRGALLGRR